MESALHERPLTVQEAYAALDAFGRDLGRVRLLLPMHASVPQSFRADLLNGYPTLRPRDRLRRNAERAMTCYDRSF